MQVGLSQKALAPPHNLTLESGDGSPLLMHIKPRHSNPSVTYRYMRTIHVAYTYPESILISISILPTSLPFFALGPRDVPVSWI